MSELHRTDSGDIANSGWDMAQQLRDKERKIVGLALLLVIIVALFDAAEDLINNEGGIALIIDFTYVGVMLGLLFYIWRLTPSSLRKKNDLLSEEVVTAHRDVKKWRSRASVLLEGLSRLVAQQFADWELSKAEREIGFLLLKGLSLKEIAAIRNTTERTVRQQTTSLYRKANINGRAKLSAFFLEDLLLPPYQEK